MTSQSLNAVDSLKAVTASVALTANDLEKSLRFYSELGFTVKDRYETDGKLEGVMLESGDSALMLTQDDFAKGKDRPKGEGMRMYIETDQDLGALATQARVAGFKVHGDPAPLGWGPMGFAVTDSDGFNLTISGPMPQ